jgi:hypothetical protein
MQLSLRIALIAITLIYLFFIFKAIKNKKMQISFSVFWIITGFILIIAIAIPNMIENISKLLGFKLSVNMIFCVAIFLAFYLIFSLNIAISKENKKNTMLIQEISLLKKRVEELENKK